MSSIGTRVIDPPCAPLEEVATAARSVGGRAMHAWVRGRGRMKARAIAHAVQTSSRCSGMPSALLAPCTA